MTIHKYFNHEYEIFRDFNDDFIIYAQTTINNKVYIGVGKNANFEIAMRCATVHCALQISMFVVEHANELNNEFNTKFKLLRKKSEEEKGGIKLLDEARHLKFEYAQILNFKENALSILQDAKKYLVS